jgi:UDP-galactopyranose mutase
VLRDLFRKSGRPLERELDLVPVEPMREHRFEDGSAVALPSGSRAAQQQAIDAGLGPGLGDRWLDWTHGFADTWNLLRRDYLERPYSPDHVGKETRATLTTRTTLHRAVTRAFKDERLRALALAGTVLDGHDPRNVPAWVGMTAYVEQNFGVWTVPGGMGALAGAMTKRLGERRVDVRLGTTVEDLVVRDGRATGVVTDGGLLEADLVVCAVDPRRLPALASLVRRTMPALPPVVCHLGLQGDVPALRTRVLHGDPLLVVRTGGPPLGGALDGAGGAGSRRTSSPRSRAEADGASRSVRSTCPARFTRRTAGRRTGVGRPTTLRHRLSTTTPMVNVFCAAPTRRQVPGCRSWSSAASSRRPSVA